MRDIITEIWQTARRNKLRTTLTGFAVAWGIFMIIVLLGAGNGLINANLKQSDRFLSSSMVVFGGWTSKPYQGLKEGRDIRLHESDMTITKPQIILADEPTGALDSKTSVEVMQLLKQLNQEEGMTIVVVTHESGVANETNKIVHIKDGIIGQIEENLNHNASPFGSGGLMK